jgi:hypothetical protein
MPRPALALAGLAALVAAVAAQQAPAAAPAAAPQQALAETHGGERAGCSVTISPMTMWTHAAPDAHAEPTVSPVATTFRGMIDLAIQTDSALAVSWEFLRHVSFFGAPRARASSNRMRGGFSRSASARARPASRPHPTERAGQTLGQPFVG